MPFPRTGNVGGQPAMAGTELILISLYISDIGERGVHWIAIVANNREDPGSNLTRFYLGLGFFPQTSMISFPFIPNPFP